VKKKTVTVLLKYGITTLVGALIVWAVIDFHGYAEAISDAERYRILSDAFTIPGITLMLCWLLVYVANEGAFEGISYAVSYAIKMLIPGGARTHEKFSDYVVRKRESGKVRGTGFLFFTGAAFFLVALVFIALFYSVY